MFRPFRKIMRSYDVLSANAIRESQNAINKVNAVNTVQEVAGLEEQTIEYPLRYQYGEQLVKKLAEAMEK